MSYFSSDFKLGILGGGQLGKMLLYVTRKYDIYTKVIDANKNAPSRLACNEFIEGDILDYNTVLEFGRTVDVLTFEIENVNVDALETLEKEGKKVFPSSKTLRTIQNKATQKAFYTSNKIPTAAFFRHNNPSEIISAINNKTIEYPFVWKSARFGYDGNGVKIIRTADDLSTLPNVECITETLVPFKNELSVIVARNQNGAIKTYPTVEMEFHPEANQVEYVLSPARLPQTITQKAEDLALKVAHAFKHVGLLAVELFLTQDNDLLVNEVAPRPHNSGHLSIESNFTCQFEQHLRAILNLPLGNTDHKVSGVMVNLVGAENYSGEVMYKNIEDIMAMDGVTTHIYGKKQTRPFRKMGHVTIINKDINTARQIAQNVKETIQVISK